MSSQEGTASPESPTIAFEEWVYVANNTNANQMAEDSDQEGATWLDDLVEKEHSGVGFAYNQVYKDDGYKHEYHVFEDKCIRMKFSDNCYLYGVFDGHCGIKAAEFVSQRLPAEIVLGQLNNITCETEVQQLLQQAYHTVEKSYFSTLDDLIAERTSLQQELLNAKGIPLKPESVERLRIIDQQLSCGTSALIALILNGKMYIANVGNSRALLCRTESGKLIVEKLNDDHTLENPEEVQRLASLGLPMESIRNSTKFGHQLYTRCIGDYSVKGGYKDNEQMSAAISVPVIADPEIVAPILIDSTCNFLLLMTDGVYRSLIDATATEHVSADIAGMLATEFPRQSTLNGVGQAVIDRITRKHHDEYALAKPGDLKHSKCSSRDDMTLLIRNFNYQLRKLSVDNSAPRTTHSTSSSRDDTTPTNLSPTNTNRPSEYSNPFFAHLRNHTPAQSLLDTYMDSNPDSFADSIKSNASATALEVDADGRIEAYVNFGDFDAAMEAMDDKERREFEKCLVPKMDCETILEQPEGVE